MVTRIEQFSTELWLEVFSYLNVRHQFNAFYDLNQRFNQILFSHRHQIAWKNADADAQHLLEHVLPFLTKREQIAALQLENMKRIDLDTNADLFHFPRLMTLSLHRIHVSADFVKLFERNTTHLRSLYTSSMISGEKKMFRALLTMILSLSHLHTCQLRLAIGTGPIPPASVLKSPIQRLKLVGPTEVCVLDRLSVLLGYLPLLQSLSIVAQKLAWTSTPSKSDLNIQVPISTFTLKIQELDIPVYLFLQFVSSVMPQLETLTIICLFAQPNHSYLDRIQWNALLLDSLPNLRQVILMIHRASTVDESIWNKKCELLGKNFARRRVALRIIGKT